MTKGTIGTYLTAAALCGALLLPVLASAQVGAAAHAATPATTAAGAATIDAPATAKLDAKATAAKAKGDQEIDRRIQALNDLNTRVDNMQRVTATFKQNLSGNIQTQITGLTQLKAKIDADTDLATLKTDIQSVTQSYRIFALVLPMSRIAAQADREVTIITMMNQLGAKLQARISAAQQAGGNTSALLATLTDLSNKLADASTQAQAGVSVSAALTPDNGDKTKMAQNAAALKTARADLEVSQKDLIAARKDVQTIIAGLAKLPTGTASSSASATASSSAAH
jgi:hypothetical protein